MKSLIISLLLALATPLVAADSEPGKPNIVFLLVDDFGKGPCPAWATIYTKPRTSTNSPSPG